jgi:hypothetical protein
MVVSMSGSYLRRRRLNDGQPELWMEETRMSRTARSIFALLVLTFLLGTGAAQALPSSNGPSPERVSGTLAAIWDWLASVFEVQGGVAHIFDAAVGDIVHTPPLPTGSQTDVGGFIDPNGGS